MCNCKLKNKKELVYESPIILIIDVRENIITNSPATDPNEGEWDVEGDR